MSRIDQIRKQLALPTTAQEAWAALSRKERSVFIKLAGLEAVYLDVIIPNFDQFKQSHKVKLSKAIRLASNIACKFNAHLKPVSVLETNELRAA